MNLDQKTLQLILKVVKKAAREALQEVTVEAPALLMTVSQTAKFLGISKVKVNHLYESGELEGINIASKGSSRSALRIYQESAECWQQRTPRPATKKEAKCE